MSKFQILKIRDVKIPERGTKVSSGIDFFVPYDLIPQDLVFTPLSSPCFHTSCIKGTTIYISPGEGVKIPTGIKCIIEEGFDLTFENKSGVAVKKGLIVGACVVDSDYRGEVSLHLINTSKDIKTIELGEKILQGIIRKVELDLPEQITELDFLSQNHTERGEGGFGSTGIK